MKLKDSDFQEAKYGLPAYTREWWDIGDGYEIYVSISSDSCTIGIDSANKDITFEVANYLGLDTSKERIAKWGKREEELYVQVSIDCVVIIYQKPEKYIELLKKIESIINKHFKNKEKKRA